MYISFSPEDVVKTASIIELQQLIRVAQQRVELLKSYRLDENEENLVSQRKSVEAIKALRNRLGLTLMEAKTVVDYYRDTDASNGR